jgi:DNA-binding Lrp family transcriptional regulator
MSALVNSAQRAAREERIWRLRLAGRTEREIAAEVGMSQPGVHRVLERTERRVLAEARGMIMRLKAVQAGRLEVVVTEALAAFERSKQPAEKEVTEAKRGADGNAAGGKIQRVKEGRDGDPAWLNVALAAHDRIAALWGLEAPKRVSVERDPDPVEQLSDAALLEAVQRELDEERRRMVRPPVREATP